MADTILQRAKELEGLVNKHAELRQLKNALLGFKTRRDTLREIAKSLHSLVQVQKVLLDGGIPIENSGTSLKEFLDKVSEITERFIKNPKSILQQRAVDLTQFQNTINAVSYSMTSSWKRYTAPGDQGEVLVNVLERYQPFRENATRIRSLRQQLT
jgi:hypothetical protein